MSESAIFSLATVWNKKKNEDFFYRLRTLNLKIILQRNIVAAY